MTRKRSGLDTKSFDSVDQGGKSEEHDTYTMTLKKMSTGTIERYRKLRQEKLIAETSFSKWINNMILDKLAELESVSKSRKQSK